MGHSAASSDGLYARIAVRPPPGCILRRLSEEYTITHFVPGVPDSHRPQVVLEQPAGEERDVTSTDGIEEVMRLDDRVFCYLRHAEPADEATEATETSNTTEATDATSADADRASTLSYGFGFLPIMPVAFRFHDGWVDLHLVTAQYQALRATVNCLRDREFDVDLRQVIQGGRHELPATDDRRLISAIDLSTLTDRQREVAAVAVGMGYFRDDGASTAEIASALTISKSTLSEHLRIVVEKVLSQVFP